MLSNIGTPELMILGLVLLFLFGGKKIPELARGVGEAMLEFKRAAKADV
jgi:sec-independent protein translocase protein TatA